MNTPSPLITSAPLIGTVPWDRAALQGRECASCACYFHQTDPTNPAQTQGFCRRQPAELQKMRGLEPRRDQKGAVIVGKDQQPIMQPAEVIGYLFKTTRPEGTCFDGWRPLGTLPGEQPSERMLRQMASAPLAQDLPPQLRSMLIALLGIKDPDSERSNGKN